MSNSYCTISILLATLIPLTTLAAQSVPLSAACRPLIDAQRKTIVTPHHAIGTTASAHAGGKESTSELIVANGVTYLLMDGKWRRSGITPKDNLDQMNSNLASAKLFSCQHVGDEPVGGTAADVYTSHTENEGVKNDTRVWVGKGSGLVLRNDTDLDDGDGTKRHISLRYDYANVHAPAGVP